MGYRRRLGRIPKANRDALRGVSFAEDQAVYDTEGYEQLFDIGSGDFCPRDLKNFFDFELGEYEFQIVEKEQLREMIENYRKQIYSYYKEVVDELDGWRALNVLKTKMNEWEALFQKPYYLDEEHNKKDGAIVRSWHHDYAIFNIVYIYQHFDWENDYLILCGW